MPPVFVLEDYMGIFSSKYKTTVATTTARVIEDHVLPDSVRSGMIKGLFNDPDQLVENVMEDLSSSIGVTADRMWKYGKTKYMFGLPSSTVISSKSGEDIIKARLAMLVGQPVNIIYYHLGPLNNLHAGWVKLTQQYGYDINTHMIGLISTILGKPAKLTSIDVVVTDASLEELNNGSLDQWDDSVIGVSGLTSRPDHLFQLDSTSLTDYVKINYNYETVVDNIIGEVNYPKTVVTPDFFHINITDYNQSADYHQVKYSKADGSIAYWLYEAGSGTYSDVDLIHKTEQTPAGSYYPWGYFRFNATAGNADKSSQAYKQSVKLMNFIGIDYDTITDSIHENPDIKQVEQAMLVMAVPAATSNQMEMRYLYDYFSQMLVNTGGEISAAKPYVSQGTLFEQINNQLNSSNQDSSIVIQDSRFKMALGFRHISKVIYQGTFGKKGEYQSGWFEETITETGLKAGTTTPVTFNTLVKTHWYRKQITEFQYEEIRVNNLRMVYYIYESYSDTADGGEDILMIPLDRSITQNYSIPDRELLYARSLHYIFNSRVVTEIKWYQTGIFQAFMVIAAIAITIFTYGSTWTSVAAALSAGTITIGAVLYMVAIEVLKMVLIGLALKLFVKVVGVKFAFIIAIVAALAGAYQVVAEGGLKDAPWAKELLSVSTGLTKSINNQLVLDYKELQQDAIIFEDYVKEEQKKLDAANALLENNSAMIPLIIFGEKPDDFYQRTVHSGNIGVLSLDMINSYVDSKLVLPKLNDTIEGI